MNERRESGNDNNNNSTALTQYTIHLCVSYEQLNSMEQTSGK